MPSTARSRWTRVATGAVAAVAALTMVGCGHPGGSTAFQVEGNSVSLNELETAADACAEPLGFAPEAMDLHIRTIALQGLIGKTLAEQNGLSFTDAQVRQVLTEQEVAGALDVPGCAEIAENIGIFFLAATRVGADKGIEQISAMNVQVNPRLGSWDAEELALRHTNGSLSEVGPATLDSQG